MRNALGGDDWIGLYEKAVRWCLGLKSRLIVILVILVCFVVSLFRCLVVRSSVSVSKVREMVSRLIHYRTSVYVNLQSFEKRGRNCA